MTFRPEVHYEVYLKERGRWMIQAVHDERAPALARAQSLRRAGNRGVKVVQETYYPRRDQTFARVILEIGPAQAPARVRVAVPAPVTGAARAAERAAATLALGPGAAAPWLMATTSGLALAVAMVGTLLALS